jgi:hypothetical protein
MRKTSAPASNSEATTALSVEAGPRVAMILMRRRLLIERLPHDILFIRRGRLNAAAAISRTSVSTSFIVIS